MKGLNIILLLACLASSVTASPLEKRACQANNCLRAVSGTANAKVQSTQKADCSSFQRTTVIPATVTSVTTVTVTAPQTGTLSFTTVSTIPATAFSTVSTESDVTQTSSFTTVQTNTRTSTVVTSVGSTAVIFAKRAASSGTATTVSPNRIPTYASACSAAGQYSSACSCYGVTGSKTTLSAPTTVVTSTVTVSPTVFLSRTTVVSTISTSTSTIVSTFTSFFTTSVTSTSTTDVDTTTTVTSVTSVTTCRATQAVVNGGFESGSIEPFVISFTPNFFDNPTGYEIDNDPQNANMGNYYLNVVETDQSLGGISFSLVQQVSVCPGQPYLFTFATTSQINVAGATQCNLLACAGGVCVTFDPGNGGPHVGQQNSILYTPGPGETTTTLNIYTPEIFPGTGVTFCGRQYVKFDSIALTPVL